MRYYCPATAIPRITWSSGHPFVSCCRTRQNVRLGGSVWKPGCTEVITSVRGSAQFCGISCNVRSVDGISINVAELLGIIVLTYMLVVVRKDLR